MSNYIRISDQVISQEATQQEELTSCQFIDELAVRKHKIWNWNAVFKQEYEIFRVFKLARVASLKYFFRTCNNYLNNASNFSIVE